MLDMLNKDVTVPTYAYLALVFIMITLLIVLTRSTDKRAKLQAELDDEVELTSVLLLDVIHLHVQLNHKNQSINQYRATIDDLTSGMPTDEVDDKVTRLSFCFDCGSLRWPEHFQMNPDHVVRRLNTAKPDDN